MESTVIKIKRCSDRYFIWDADHVRFIRTKWRITGDLVGCSAVCFKQNNVHGMPLTLSKIEAKFILTHYPSNSKLVETTPAIASEDFDHEKVQKEITEQRERQLKAQTHVGLKYKAEELDKKAFHILRGMRDKRKRKSDVCENDDTYDDDWSKDSAQFKALKEKVLEKVKTGMTLSKLFVEVPLQSVYGGTEQVLGADDVVLSPLELLQYRVFCDLNLQRGMFLSSGGKYGGHFLAYLGDPALYHSAYVVYCKLEDEQFDSYKRAARGRTATTTRKKFVICSVDEDDQLVYKSLKRIFF